MVAFLHLKFHGFNPELFVFLLDVGLYSHIALLFLFVVKTKTHYANPLCSSTVLSSNVYMTLGPKT